LTTPEILLVEDDDAVRSSLAECLELEGWVVQMAADGAEALAWLREGHLPRVVILDLVMPRMNGEDLMREIRGDSGTRDLPVVLMTGAAPAGDRLPPANALLVKPFSLSDLLEAIRRFL